MTRILHVREQVRQDSLMFSSYGSHVVLHMVLFMVLHTVYVHGSTYSFFTWSYAWFLLVVLLIVSSYGSTHGIRSLYFKFLPMVLFMLLP